MAKFGQISYSDTGALDAFSRLRTSNPESLFSIQNQYNASPTEMEGGATGTGVAPTWSANTRMVALTANAGTGVSFYQSYQYTPYEAGKGQIVAMTGVMGSPVAGAIVDFGYFDANNGVVFRQNGTTNLQIILRTSTSGVVSDANIVNQADWNIDGLNSGLNSKNPSGKTLDVTKSVIMIIDLQFLGMGRVRVGFDIDGVIYYVHQFLNANVLAIPYIQSATLPVGMLITATSTLSAKTAYFKCATVQSEGGNSLSEFGLSLSTPEVTVTAASGARTPILSIRPKTTYNGVVNRTLFILQNINMFVTGNQDVYWELCVGATLTGTTWADINTTYSAFEYTSVPGTFSNLTNGVVIASGYMSRLGGTNNGTPIITPAIDSLRYPIALDRSGATRTFGTLTLLVTGISGNSATRSNINFKEIR